MNQKDYLKTPEHFRQLVQAAVDEQLNKENVEVVHTHSERKWRYGLGRAAAAVVMVMIVGTTAFAAAWHFRISDAVPEADQAYMETLVSEKQTVSDGFPELLEDCEADNGGVFEEPLVAVTEVYYDGMNLYLYGTATEAGKNYSVYTSRVIVNGKQYLGDFYRNSGQHSREGFGNDEYIGWFTLDGETGDDFTVELPLSIYLDYDYHSYQFSGLGEDGKNLPGRDNFVHIYDGGQYSYTEKNELKGTEEVIHYDVLNEEERQEIIGRKGEQTITFEVTRDETVTACENQYVGVTDSVTLTAADIMKTAGGVRMNLKWHLSSEAAEQYDLKDGVSGPQPAYEVTDQDGTVYDSSRIDVNYQATVEDIGRCNFTINEDGSVDYLNKIFIKNMPQSTESLTIQWIHRGEVIGELKAEIPLE